ncbi:MAG: efflux RND transporter permease subunit [Candidatus Latescibacterota bacterium]|nr:MAG: efflux RND transporter permease subunit [Candidatus Latescibacterota bacterium]
MLKLVIQRPIAIAMLFLALMLIGVLSFRRIPVDLLPSITYPRLTVITTYEDIPAEDLERLVTQRLEEVVTALSGVRRVISRTREGISIITVEYEWGTQMDFANLHLREAVDRVAFRDDFPEDAERPVILRWDPLSRPISILTLKGGDRIESMTEFATEVVKPALQQVEGISQAEVVGGVEREIIVEPDVKKMAIYGITIDDIQQALARSNISFPGGKIRQGPLHLSLRIVGEFETLEDIETTDIIRSGQSPIRVSDVARVIDSVKELEGVTLLGGDPVVSFLLYKEPEANTIQVSEEVDKALSVLAEDYGDFDYSFVYRDAEYVRASFQGLVQSLIIGACLAFLVLFLFLRDVRSPVVVGVSIPVSIFITFALLYFGKVKLNLMSLGGLSLAAGMLVDNAIVVLENINRHLSGVFKKDTGEPSPAADITRIERKREVAGASVKGTGEVARAVLAATLTTVAVFFPVVYVPGIAGAFFRDQALAVVFSLLVSVATALLLQPMLSARILAKRQGPPRGLFRLFNAGFEAFYRLYHSVLVRVLRRPALMLLCLTVGLVAAGLLGLQLRRSFMPERSSGDFRIEIEYPSGTPLEETAAAVAVFAEWITDDADVKNVFSQVGRTEKTLESLNEYTAPNTAIIRVILEPGRGGREKGERLQREAAERLDRMPGALYSFRDEGIGLGEILATDEAAFSMGIVAEDPLVAVQVAEQLLSGLSEKQTLRDIQIDRVIGTPNLVVHLDAEEILRSGLDPDIVARELRNRIRGVEATTFNEVDQRIDISVRIPRQQRRDLALALDSPIEITTGETVPLRSFLDVTEEAPVRELTRRNQRRMVTISADLRRGSIDDAWHEAMAVANTLDLPAGVRLVQSGERAEMTRSFKDLGWAMLLAVMLVYMILAAQFESFIDPLLIAAVIPIGFGGSILAIAVTGGSINILSLIGMVALLGIAVNDAIIKVDTIRRLRQEGTDGYTAILEASRLRLRPILMTSASTILAMVPLAIGLGSGEQLQRPLALTIIGGLFLTTSLTLLYTPILYKLAHRIRRPEV